MAGSCYICHQRALMKYRSVDPPTLAALVFFAFSPSLSCYHISILLQRKARRHARRVPCFFGCLHAPPAGLGCRRPEKDKENEVLSPCFFSPFRNASHTSAAAPPRSRVVCRRRRARSVCQRGECRTLYSFLVHCGAQPLKRHTSRLTNPNKARSLATLAILVPQEAVESARICGDRIKCPALFCAAKQPEPARNVEDSSTSC